MLDALAEHLPPEATWTHPEGGLFIWATLPDYIDTTDLLARALRENVAFVPGRAAFLDGRGGSSMRLNFSGVGEDDIREGVRADRQGRARAGRAVLDADRHDARAAPAGASGARRGGRRPRRPCTSCARGGRASDEPRRGAQGRALARAPGVAALGRARRGRAGALGHERDLDRRRARPRRPPAARAPGRRVRRAARPGRRGRHRPGAARARRRALHRLDARRLRALLGQDRRQAPDARRRDPDARLLLVQRRPHSTSSARPRRCPRSRSGSTSRSSSSPRARARRWASSSPARRRTSPARSSRRSPTTRRSCSSATSPAATSRSRCSTAPAARRRCRSSRRSRRSPTPMTSRRATRSAARASPVRRSSTRRSRGARRSSRWRSGSCSAAPASRASTSCSRRDRRAVACSRPTRSPGLTETSLLPQAAEAAGIAFEDLIARVLELAAGRPLAAPPRRAPTAPRT